MEAHNLNERIVHAKLMGSLWCQLEDMFQLIVTPQGFEKVMIQLIDTPTIGWFEITPTER